MVLCLHGAGKVSAEVLTADDASQPSVAVPRRRRNGKLGGVVRVRAEICHFVTPPHRHTATLPRHWEKPLSR